MPEHCCGFIRRIHFVVVSYLWLARGHMSNAMSGRKEKLTHKKYTFHTSLLVMLECIIENDTWSTENDTCSPLAVVSNQDLFRLLDQREQEKMEWEWLEGGGDGRTRAAPLSLSHGLVRILQKSEHMVSSIPTTCCYLANTVVCMRLQCTWYGTAEPPSCCVGRLHKVFQLWGAASPLDGSRAAVPRASRKGTILRQLLQTYLVVLATLCLTTHYDMIMTDCHYH